MQVDKPNCSVGAPAGLARYAGFFLFLLRAAVGWHFAYEAYVKIAAPGAWTAYGYLKNAPTGPLKSAFHWVADQPALLRAGDVFMSWGMLVAGLLFMVGLLTRLSGAALALMLVLFYLSAPPWAGQKLPPEEGNYLYVNKNVIELLAILAVTASGVSRVWGLDGMFARRSPAALADQGLNPRTEARKR